MDDTTRKLHDIARTNADPNVRRQAVERLQSRGAWSGSVEDYQKGMGRLNATNARTERLRADAEADPYARDDYTEIASDVGRKVLEATETGMTDVYDAATFGGWRAARDGITDAIDPRITNEKRTMEARQPEALRTVSRAIPAFASGAGAAQLAQGMGQGLIRTLGTTAAVEAPIAMSRRMSEGESVGDAAQGGVVDAALGAAVGGALAGGGKLLDTVRRGVRRIGPKGDLRAAIDDAPDARGKYLDAQDEEFQALTARNKQVTDFEAREAAEQAQAFARRAEFAQAEYEMATKRAITPKNADRIAGDVRQKIVDAQHENWLPDTQTFLDDGLHERLSEVRKMITPKKGSPVTAERILSVRREIQARAAKSPEWQPVLDRMESALDDVAPEVANARSGLREAMSQSPPPATASSPTMTESRLGELARARGVGSTGRAAAELVSADPASGPALKRLSALDARDKLAEEPMNMIATPARLAGRVANTGARGVSAAMSEAAQPISILPAMGAPPDAYDDTAGADLMSVMPTAPAPRSNPAPPEARAAAARDAELIRNANRAAAVRRRKQPSQRRDDVQTYDPITGEQQ